MHGRSRYSLDFFIGPSLWRQTAALTIFCPASEYKQPAARIQKNTGVESATRPTLMLVGLDNTCDYVCQLDRLAW
jgi:hypothetical protein